MDVVDNPDQEDSAEERCYVDPVPPGIPIGGNEGVGALDEDLDERHIQHHASGEPRSHRQESVVRSLGEQRDRAADTGGHPGEDRQSQSNPHVTHLTHLSTQHPLSDCPSKERRLPSCLQSAYSLLTVSPSPGRSPSCNNGLLGLPVTSVREPWRRLVPTVYILGQVMHHLLVL